jgi:WD40 repeat protein
VLVCCTAEQSTFKTQNKTSTHRMETDCQEDAWIVSAGCQDRLVQVHNVNSGGLIAKQTFGSGLNGLAVNTDASLLALSENENHRVLILRPHTLEVVHTINCIGNASPFGVVFSHHGLWLVVGDSRGYVTIYDTTNWSLLRSVKAQDATSIRVVFSMDDATLLVTSGSSSDCVSVWNTTDLSLVKRFLGHTSWIRAGTACTRSCQSMNDACIIVLFE